MTGQAVAVPVPDLAELKDRASAILREFNLRKIIFLNPQGSWKEGPQTLRDRISHALFFKLRSEGEDEAVGFFASVLGRLASPENWPVTQKLGLRLLEGEPPQSLGEMALALGHEVIVWLIRREAFRLNAEALAPDWNSEARALKAEYGQKLRSLEDFELQVLAGAEREKLLDVFRELVQDSSSPIGSVARLIAEEEKTTASLERLITGFSSKFQEEELYAAVIEKIQPPMGIVTHLSPALFFPCLCLLLDARIPIASGIPYAASVSLSIFKDPRSTAALLQALNDFPLTCTKVRENIIYTLGNLGEGKATAPLIRVLEAPDEVTEADEGKKTACLLLEQKEEAIWALGKIGLEAVSAVPALARYADHPSSRLKTYLAWTLGEIGGAQKAASGGVNADIVIALLKLLKEKNRQIFEEAVGALKKIGMPEFVHSLYLYHVGAVTILGLKPAQRGLYELSETLHYLLRTKKRTIMAVNGDSGTGKTYFCQAIAGGFGGLKPGEILYLMRDTKRGQKVFNRLLGLRWLKKNIDPAYYQDYPVSEEEDDPEAYFRRFLEENADKRLIILDGCRDRYYFQKVIDFFYLRGELDVEVNFRANFSTRRLNLEEREVAVESVKLHLAFLEEPALEDTFFYQEGLVVLYDMDNSRGSRLNREETRELFDAQRIDSWGELIRMGDFTGERWTTPCRKKELALQKSHFEIREESWPESHAYPFSPEERKLLPVLNADLRAEPNLLKTIPLGELRARQIRYYAQDQVAGLGEKGEVFVLTLLDNRIFQASLINATDFALLGRTFYLIEPDRGFVALSFEHNEILEWKSGEGAPWKVASFPPDKIITAHRDGWLRVWDCLEKKVWSWDSGIRTIDALAVDQRGRVYAAEESGDIKQWDLDNLGVRTIQGMGAHVRFIRPYPYGKILTIEEPNKGNAVRLRLFDLENRTSRTAPLPPGRTPSGINVYYDGRVITSFFGQDTGSASPSGNLLIITPREDVCSYLGLSGHAGGTEDCLAMGPKIVTCGREPDGGPAIRIWGSEFFVRTELSKLFIKP
jgi:hypothetical protein